MEQEIPEQLMVISTNAVTSPWAVVVHPHHAFIADAAMVGTGWPHDLTLKTVAPVDEGASFRIKEVLDMAFDQVPLIGWHREDSFLHWI